MIVLTRPTIRPRYLPIPRRRWGVRGLGSITPQFTAAQLQSQFPYLTASQASSIMQFGNASDPALGLSTQQTLAINAWIQSAEVETAIQASSPSLQNWEQQALNLAVAGTPVPNTAVPIANFTGTLAPGFTPPSAPVAAATQPIWSPSVSNSPSPGGAVPASYDGAAPSGTYVIGGAAATTGIPGWMWLAGAALGAFLLAKAF